MIPTDSNILDTQGYVLIRSLCYRHTDAIIDVKLGDTHEKIYIFEPMSALLAWWEKIKKYNHDNHCHEQQIIFSPFVLSVDGMLGREALVILENLSQLMAAKMDEPISHVQVWINGQFEIAVARSYSRMIC